MGGGSREEKVTREQRDSLVGQSGPPERGSWCFEARRHAAGTCGRGVSGRDTSDCSRSELAIVEPLKSTPLGEYQWSASRAGHVAGAMGSLGARALKMDRPRVPPVLICIICGDDEARLSGSRCSLSPRYRLVTKSSSSGKTPPLTAWAQPSIANFFTCSRDTFV